VLQTAARVDEQAINAKLFEAEQKLDGLKAKLNDLSDSERAQYTQARGFIRLARNALQIRNYLYAEELARKAAAVANQLGRG